MRNSNDRKSYQLDADLIMLRALVAIADEGTFSAAAKRIGRTQSAVSLQISKLEERLGTRLLQRTSRSVSQTEAGEVMVAYARRILELADEAVLALSAPSSAEPLRVGFAEYLVPFYLHGLLARFRRAHASTDIELKLGRGTELLHSYDAGELDVVIAGPEKTGGRLLLEEPLIWVCNPQFDESEKDPLPLVLLQPPCSHRKAGFEALTKAGINWVVPLEANSTQGIKSAVEAGLGVSIMPRSALSPEIQPVTGRLPPLPNTAMVAYSQNSAPHPLATRFIDFLSEGINEFQAATTLGPA